MNIDHYIHQLNCERDPRTRYNELHARCNASLGSTETYMTTVLQSMFAARVGPLNHEPGCMIFGPITVTSYEEWLKRKQSVFTMSIEYLIELAELNDSPFSEGLIRFLCEGRLVVSPDSVDVHVVMPQGRKSFSLEYFPQRIFDLMVGKPDSYFKPKGKT